MKLSALWERIVHGKQGPLYTFGGVEIMYPETAKLEGVVLPTTDPQPEVDRESHQFGIVDLSNDPTKAAFFKYAYHQAWCGRMPTESGELKDVPCDCGFQAVYDELRGR